MISVEALNSSAYHRSYEEESQVACLVSVLLVPMGSSDHVGERRIRLDS